jgi:membrane-associated phospholipid phosphatase
VTRERGLGTCVRALTCVIGMALALAPATAPAAAAEPDRPAVDQVVFWNDQTNQAIQATSTDPFKAARVLALESIAVLDTVKSLSGAPAFLVRLPAPPAGPPAGPASGPPDATADDLAVGTAAAAHAMLCHLFPTRQAILDAALASSLTDEPAGAARNQATAFGKAVADAVFAIRDRDGWDAAGTVRPGIVPGQWRPTPPKFLPAMDPQWATMTPFVLSGPDQFRPPGPPAPGTVRFDKARAAVASIGGSRSPVRTAEQTAIAHYWSDAIGTYAPAGHWNAITARIVAARPAGIAAEAELFAELNVAIADAAIAMADAKYTYWSWRPITAIRAGGDSAAPVPDWSSLLETPNHPSYISGHSSLSGAAATVLTAWFGTIPFSFASDSLPGVTRSFTSFQQAAEEAAQSRVYGGIHYPFDNVDGLATGRAVGAWTLKVFQRIAKERGPVIVLDRSINAGGPGSEGGFALDNLSPVTMVTARLDGGEPVRFAVDGRGRFALSPAHLSSAALASAGRHEIVLTATSASGRTIVARQPIVPPGAGDAVTVPLTTQ